MGFNCGLGTIRDTFTYDKEILKKLARHNLHKSSYIIPNLCTSPYSLLLDSQSLAQWMCNSHYLQLTF